MTASTRRTCRQLLIFSVLCAGMLAADARCKTLDASADGYGRAEACVLLVVWEMAARWRRGGHRRT